MTNNDPWGTPEPEPEYDPPAAPYVAPVAASVTADNHGATVTFKAGPRYSESLIVTRGNDVADVLEQIGGSAAGLSNGQAMVALFDIAARQQKYFVSLFEGAPTSSTNTAAQSNNVPSSQPNRTGPPNGETKYCQHGERVYREGINGSGKPYKGHFCPSNDRDNQCKPEWAK